uniref:Uncharacterized protein n=1 Tax=Arundo donax TaxID=35708 RepID=A0A0A9BX10_ARUDO
MATAFIIAYVTKSLPCFINVPWLLSHLLVNHKVYFLMPDAKCNSSNFLAFSLKQPTTADISFRRHGKKLPSHTEQCPGHRLPASAWTLAEEPTSSCERSWERHFLSIFLRRFSPTPGSSASIPFM